MRTFGPYQEIKTNKIHKGKHISTLKHKHLGFWWLIYHHVHQVSAQNLNPIMKRALKQIYKRLHVLTSYPLIHKFNQPTRMFSSMLQKLSILLCVKAKLFTLAWLWLPQRWPGDKLLYEDPPNNSVMWSGQSHWNQRWLRVQTAPDTDTNELFPDFHSSMSRVNRNKVYTNEKFKQKPVLGFQTPGSHQVHSAGIRVQSICTRGVGVNSGWLLYL